MVHLKHSFSLSLIGFVLSGFGGGLLFGFYFVTLNNILLIGSVIAMIGMGLTLFTLANLKGIWSFEELRD